MTDLSTIIKEWRKRGSEGPWTLGRELGDLYLHDAHGNLIMHNEQYYPHPVTNEADWHFIAAAPAMADRIEALEEHICNMLAAQECGCGYDNPTDICLGHATVLKRIEALEAENARLRVALMQMVGATVYLPHDGFSKPHEHESSRIARAALGET